MKQLMVILVLLLTVALLLPVSCARAPVESEEMAVETVVQAPREEVYEEVYVEKGGAAGDLQLAAEERMIIRSGDISLAVEDVVDTRDEIAQLAVGLGGFVVSSWISGEEEGMRGSISIRVPDEKFDQSLVEIRNLAVRVDSESTNSRDVTEEYIDLEARLKNAEATENQYLVLLEKAEDVEDTLKIYDSLSRVRREIEQIKGQMQYLERTSSMSLITAQLRPVASDKPLVPVGWNVMEALKSAIRGIVIFGQWLVTVIIWLLILSPVWGTTFGIIYWRRRQRKKAQ